MISRSKHALINSLLGKSKNVKSILIGISPDTLMWLGLLLRVDMRGKLVFVILKLSRCCINPI